MDNDDGAFATDAAIDAAIRNRSPNKAKPRASTDSAAGRYSVDDSRVNSSEDTPLLVSGDEGGSISDGEENVEEDPFASLPWWKRPSIYWILPIFLLATLAFGGVLIPQLNLILELVCRNYISEQSAANPNFSMAPVVFGQENPQCRTDAVQKRVAQFTLACNVISGLLSAITSPKFGALSDRFGRNKLIALCSTGALFREIMMICAARNPDTFPVSLLLIGYALDGLCGSFTALMAIVHSYATDVTTSANRNSAFGYFHGCLFAGIALGPLFAAFVIERTHTVISIFYIAFAVHIFYILFFVFVVPESVSKARQQAAREKYQEERASYGPAADWISHIRSVNILEPLKILYPTGPGSSPALRRNLILLSAVDAIVFGVAIGAMTVIVIYVNYQFGWDTVTTSKFTSLVNVTRVFCLLCIFPLVTWIYKRRRRNQPAAGEEEKHRGMNMLDLGVIRVAVFFDTIGLLGYSLARTPALFALSGCLAAVGGIGSPALQSALTKHVPPDRTGQILGANGLLHALARVWGPMIFNGIYSLTVGKYTQTVFVCLTATFFVAFICTWFVRPNVYLDESPVAAEAAHNDEAIRRLLGSARLSQEPADVS